MLTSTKTAAAAILAADPTIDAEGRKALLAALENAATGKITDAPPRIISRGQVAERVGRTPRTVDLWVRQKLIRKIRLPGQSRAVGFLAAEVDALLCGKMPGTTRSRPATPCGG